MLRNVKATPRAVKGHRCYRRMASVGLHSRKSTRKNGFGVDCPGGSQAYRSEVMNGGMFKGSSRGDRKTTNSRDINPIDISPNIYLYDLNEDLSDVEDS